MSPPLQTTTVAASASRPSLRRFAALAVALAAAAVLVPLRQALAEHWPAPLLALPRADLELKYQLVTLGLAGLVLLVAFVVAPDAFARHFRAGEIDAPVAPARWMGLNPKPGEGWRSIGRNFAIVITLVTAGVVWLQLAQGRVPSLDTWQANLHWIVLFALANAFVEEMIFRIGVVVPLLGIVPARTLAIASGALFGGLHYFGAPGGLPGVLTAGFLGWFLAKALVETRGIFWPWAIHFLQDVVIFSAIFLALAV